jgi:hypothetical protein
VICAVRVLTRVRKNTSLTTAPSMFQFHLEPYIALATNVSASFMIVGNALPFMKGQVFSAFRDSKPEFNRALRFDLVSYVDNEVR